MDTYQQLFWYVWEEHMPKLGQSIIKCAMGPYRFQGDPQDVVQEVMLSAYQNWYSYDETASAFSTWVLWLTRQYLSNLYATKGVGMGPGLGNRAVPQYGLISLYQEAEDGSEPLTEIISGSLSLPEDIIIRNEEKERVQICIHELFLANRNTRKGQILEAMAALIDDGLKPSTRLIAEMVGCSHSTVSNELKEIRKWLVTTGS